jgi:hypothetical protein
LARRRVVAVQKAKADPEAYAALVARCGGETPVVGTPIKQRSPLAFLR